MIQDRRWRGLWEVQRDIVRTTEGGFEDRCVKDAAFQPDLEGRAGFPWMEGRAKASGLGCLRCAWKRDIWFWEEDLGKVMIEGRLVSASTSSRVPGVQSCPVSLW